MLTGIIVLALSMTVAIHNATPDYQSPREMAEAVKCDVDKIAFYTESHIVYKVQKEWEPGVVVMRRGTGDCKGKAAVNREALAVCFGATARIRLAREGKHAIAVYTRKDGRIGYLDDGIAGVFE